MIIDNKINDNLKKQVKENRDNFIDSLKKTKHNNIYTKDINEYSHTDPLNKKQMQEKTISLLQSRLKNNTITKEEFNKQIKNIIKNTQ